MLIPHSNAILQNADFIAQKQVDEGIDAVIVDSVLAIRKGLTKKGSKTTTAYQSSSTAEAVSVLNSVLASTTT